MLTFILAGVLAGTLGMTLVEKIVGDTPEGGGPDFDSEPSDQSDRIQLDDENNLLLADTGNDLVNAGGGDDTIDGEAGRDALYGQGGDDELRGGSFHDLLSGGEGDDLLQGQTGRDLLYGGEGDDTLEGGAWHDTLFGGAGEDTLLGGDGSDELYGIDQSRELTPDELKAQLDTNAPTPADIFIPEDTSGADYLEGGAGDDTFHLGRGDTAVGGGGDDQFDIFVDIGGEGIVTITDFQGADEGLNTKGDILQIEATDASSLDPDDYDVAADLFSGDALIMERGEVLARVLGAAETFTRAQLVIAEAS